MKLFTRSAPPAASVARFAASNREGRSEGAPPVGDGESGQTARRARTAFTVADTSIGPPGYWPQCPAGSC